MSTNGVRVDLAGVFVTPSGPATSDGTTPLLEFTGTRPPCYCRCNCAGSQNAIVTISGVTPCTDCYDIVSGDINGTWCVPLIVPSFRALHWVGCEYVLDIPWRDITVSAGNAGGCTPGTYPSRLSITITFDSSGVSPTIGMTHVLTINVFNTPSGFGGSTSSYGTGSCCNCDNPDCATGATLTNSLTPCGSNADIGTGGTAVIDLTTGCTP